MSDQAARERIRDDLDTNFLVEAGAGSGKTTSLVGRMISLVRRGVPVERIAAVTFTRKAAGELRERFQVELEHRIAKEASAEAKVRMEVALRDLDNAFLGTIHSFCGRLLRERALDAGLVPTFEELDEEQFKLRQAEFWASWLERCRLRDDPALATLRELGVPAGGLAGGFALLVQNPDVTFPAEASPAPDPAGCRRQLEKLMGASDHLMPKEEPDEGWDKLQELVRRLYYHKSIDGFETAAGLGQALAAITESACEVVQKRWPDKKAAKDLSTDWETFRTTAAAAWLSAWYAHCYLPVLEFLKRAEREFTLDRMQRGTLGFQDLLSLAAGMLRESDAARAALGRRYERLLVDEFQDTDPIQAEVCLLLASDPSEGNDWRKVTPRPGSLFVVGDPKQSIYRFRRADLDTYAAVQEQLARSGEVLQLTRNFRSSKPIEAFVNTHFAAAFQAGSSGQAAFAPMDAERKPGAADGVFWYPVTPGGPRVGVRSVLEAEAPLVASWIAGRIATGERRPEDFLVLTYNKAGVRPLAEALALRNLPVETAGADIPEERELGDLLLTLRLLADPGNPVLVVAALEGLFFGLTPAELFEAKEAGIEFSLVNPPASQETKAGKALATLRGWLDLSRRLPPDLVLERILDQTGLLAYAAGLPLGDARAGLFVHLVAAVRRAADRGAGDLRAAIEVIGSALGSPDTTASLRPGRGRAVRVMNLHKAKGLEADVVVLACPADLKDHPPVIHVRRDERGAVGYLSILDGEKRTVAQPAGWEAIALQEAALLAAEAERLRYVATTRPRAELVVARLVKMNQGGPREDKSMWAPLGPVLEARGRKLELIADEPPDRDALEDGTGASAAAAAAAARLQEASRASELATSVTRSIREEREEQVELERPRRKDGDGKAWGAAVHRAIEGLGRGRSGTGLRRYLEAVARDEGLGEGAGERLLQVLERVRRLPEWEALQAGGRRLEWRVCRVSESAEGRVVTEGVIDAAVLAGGRWQPLDWKTDDPDQPEYRAQVARYTAILAELGLPAEPGRLVRVAG